MSLIAWYKLDGNALDSSGNGYHGTASGAYEAGKINNCIYTTTSMTTPISLTNTLHYNEQGVCFGGWFKFNEAEVLARINEVLASSEGTVPVGNLLGNNHFGGMGITWSSSDPATTPKVRVSARTPTGEVSTTPPHKMVYDTWVHYLANWDRQNNTIYFYVNGEQIGSSFFDKTDLPSRNFLINGESIPAGGNGPATPLPARIDDVRVYDHTLSEKEIKELAKAKVLHYTFDEFQEPTTNILKNTLYENRTYNYIYEATSWGGDSASVIYYQTGGYNNLPYKKLIKTAPGKGGSHTNDNFYFTIEKNKTYTASVYMKASRNVSLNGYAFSLNRSSDNAYRTTSGFSVTTEWKRFEWVYDSLTDHAGSDYLIRSIIYDDTDLPLEVFWCAPQLEEKDHATPFVNGTRTGRVVDKSGYDNHAELALATTPQWVEDGKVGAGCYSFKGDVNRSIYLPYNHMLNIREEITLSCWVKRTTATYASDAHILSRNPSWYFYDSYGSGAIRAEVFIGGIRKGGQTASVPFDGNWYLVTYTYSSITKESKIYRNGQLMSSTTLGGLSSYLIDSSTSSVYIGSGGLNKGLMYDDPRIYATALSADDILSLYQSRGRLDNKGNLFLHNINQPAVVTDGLVGWWPLAGDTKDYSGFNNDGVNNGAVSTTGVTGEADTAYSFDGNDQILCGDGSSLNVSNFTLSSWIKTADATTDYNHILSKGETGSTIHMHYILYIRSGVARALFGNGVSTNSVNIGSVSNDSWHLVTGIYDGTYLKGYLDGVLTNTFTCTLTPAQKPTKQLAIGTNGVSGETYTGLIQDVRIYNRALSEGEIQLLYKEGLNLL